MNRPGLTRPPAHASDGCIDVLAMAEQELQAYFNAVRELFGSEQAQLSAEDWLHELESSKTLPASVRQLRMISINVAKRLTGRLNLTTAGALI
jgi:alkylhydroperoxidase/carboxymuconolactone decarboxylase family protein YurZ